MSLQEEQKDERFFRWLMKLAIYGLFALFFLLLIEVLVKGWEVLLK